MKEKRRKKNKKEKISAKQKCPYKTPKNLQESLNGKWGKGGFPDTLFAFPGLSPFE